jgi:hypothetical protein
MAAEDDLRAVFQNLGALPAQLDAELRVVVEAAAQEARALAPHRTGRLRGAVFARQGADSNTLVLGASIPYAPYVLYGTRKMRGNPFLAVSLARQLRRLGELLAQRWSGH